MAILKINQFAPNFEAEAYERGKFVKVSLKNYQGRWVCLFFYPLDFTFVCPTEIREFGKKEAEFEKQNCKILGCSTDSVYSHKAWFESDLKEINYPVLADTTHQISKDYGVLVEESGVSLRGTFLIDPQGNLKWFSIGSLEIGRSVNEVFRTLCALQTKGLCPAEWEPGQAPLSTAIN